MALDTVADYIGRCRIQLQDLIEPYRFSDDDLVDYLNEAMMVARRVRPDLFVGRFRLSFPDYSAGAMTETVPVDAMYRPPFIHYISGMAQLEDQEDTEDARAVALTTKFSTQLVSGQG